MANEERTRILQMVAAGNISPAEASDLLSALDAPPAPRPVVAPVVASVALKPVSKRALTIQVSEGDKSMVNVRMPLALARAAGRFIPRTAHAYLNNHEINLDDLIEGLQGSDGENTLLEVHDGDAYVRIAVE